MLFKFKFFKIHSPYLLSFFILFHSIVTSLCIKTVELEFLFRLLPKEEAAETFVELDGETQEALIHAFSDTELREVIE